MKIAYLILAHDNEDQLIKLIDALSCKDVHFFVHIDIKSEMETRNLVKKQNVYLLSMEERKNTFTYDYSLIEATIELLSVAKKKDDYKYFVLLSGQDYPIKSNKYIRDFFINNYPNNFIEGSRYNDSNSWCYQWGRYYFHQQPRRFVASLVGINNYYKKYWASVVRFPIWFYDRVITKIKGKSPRNLLFEKGLVLTAGTSWWMLTDESTDYLLRYYTQSPDVISLFQRIQVPFECFFQTLTLGNDDFKLPIYTRSITNITYANLLTRTIYRLIYDYREDGTHCGGHPFAFDDRDTNLLKTSDAIIARKFEHGSSIIDFVDNELLNNQAELNLNEK